MSSAIIYTNATRGNNSKEADMCYRSALKTDLSVRQNSNNDIISKPTINRPGQPKIREIKRRLKVQISIKDERNELFTSFILHYKDKVTGSTLT